MPFVARKLVGLSAAVLLAVGCTVGPEPPREAETPDPDSLYEVVPLVATAQIRLVGSDELTYDGPSPLLVTRSRSEDVPRAGWFLAVGVQPPIELGEGRQLLFSLAMRPGKWEGDGEYTLDTEPSDVEGEDIPSPFGDPVVVELRTLTDTLERTVYDQMPGACRAVIGRDGLEGTLECPRLATEDGREIAAEIEWTGTPAPTPTPSRTRTPAP
jgi:hypothetical protein